MSYSREYYLKNREKYLAAGKKYFAKKRAEKDEEWLKSQLKVKGYDHYQELILVLCDQNKNITVYPKR